MTIVTMSEVKVNLSSHLNSPSILRSKAELGYLWTLSKYVRYLKQIRPVIDCILVLLKKMVLIPLEPLTAEDLDLQEMKPGISELFYWNFPF